MAALTPQSAPPSDDGLRDGLAAARADLERAATIAGLTNDPIRHLLSASAAGLGAFAEGIDVMRRLASPAFVERIEVAAATAADKRAAELARAHNKRTLLIYGGALVAGLVMAAGGGFWWGWTMQGSNIRVAEQRLTVAFQDGPTNAAQWATLMENNDIARALAFCTGPRSYADQSGRKICLLPLYVEAARRGAPPEAPH